MDFVTAPSPTFIFGGSSRRTCEEEVRLRCFLKIIKRSLSKLPGEADNTRERCSEMVIPTGEAAPRLFPDAVCPRQLRCQPRAPSKPSRATRLGSWGPQTPPEPGANHKRLGTEGACRVP